MPTRNNGERNATTQRGTPGADAGVSRRDFFSTVVDGIYGAALAYLLRGDLLSINPALAANLEGPKSYDLKPKPPHFEPKAKAVIQLFMNGGPSQVDLFDPKPLLNKYAGKVP